MLTLQDCITRLTEFKQESGQRLGISKLGVFGSVARRENTEGSDLDVVVEMDQATLRRMYEIEERLGKMFNCKIDVVQMRPTLRPLLRRNIEKDAIYV
ncbi:MAG: nucleotidyltransferase domain-containing protein [Prevotella sp.]|nr:nucleotidyltransferase domain-containing protein [Prevotella sp.]